MCRGVVNKTDTNTGTNATAEISVNILNNWHKQVAFYKNTNNASIIVLLFRLLGPWPRHTPTLKVHACTCKPATISPTGIGGGAGYLLCTAMADRCVNPG